MKTTSRGGLAVVTGAAGGLGSSFARQLGERGYRLLLVDRREKQLKQVCESIAARCGVDAQSCAVDLCKREEVESLATRLRHTPDMELLVNNAGFGSLEYFVDSDAKTLIDMVDVHVAAPVILVRSVLPGMIERNRGAIINVSSVSSWLHSAGNVQYGSTKSFLTFFSMTLHQELRGTNVKVQALCPGFVRTEFHDANQMKGFTLRCTPSHFWMSADEVVNCSLQRLSSNQVVVIPGMGYSVFGRLSQMPMLQPLMRWITRVPRLAPSTVLTVDPRPAPVLAVAKGTEGAAAS